MIGNEDLCEAPRCKQERLLTLRGQGLCAKHWHQHCEAPSTEEMKFDEAALPDSLKKVCRPWIGNPA